MAGTLHQAQFARWSSICITDPGLAIERYVYIEADAGAIYPVARGERSWSTAVANGSIQIYGEPRLVRALPDWFVDAPSHDIAAIA
jgi:hypothetical protein